MKVIHRCSPKLGLCFFSCDHHGNTGLDEYCGVLSIYLYSILIAAHGLEDGLIKEHNFLTFFKNPCVYLLFFVFLYAAIVGSTRVMY